MIDRATQKPLKLNGNVPGTIRLPVSVEQLPHVQALFNANGMDYGTRYWEAGYVLTVNGEPQMTVMEFSYRVDPQFVQKLLDSAA